MTAESRVQVAAAAAPLTLSPVADARVQEANPTTNYGAEPELRVDGGTDPDVESYLRFDVTGVTIPVRKATLRLWVPAGGSTVDGPAVFTAPNTWTERGITWANRPGSTGTALDNKAAIASNAWVEYDVTAAISSNGTYSFVLKPESTDGAKFHSREGSNPPQLVVESGPVPTVTATPAPPPPTATPIPTPTPPTPTPVPLTPIPMPTPTPMPPTATAMPTATGIPGPGNSRWPHSPMPKSTRPTRTPTMGP